MTLQTAFPLTPLWFFGPLLTASFELYSPIFDPLNTYVARPIAVGLAKAGALIARAGRAVVAGVKAVLA